VHKVSFLLETITPLFMSGADGKTLELRPSAFKGMMRFWWRAVRADSNIENLWKEEAKIFGAADERFGRNKVKVVLKWDREEFESKKQKNSKNWLRSSNYSGVRYLLYSLGLQKREFLNPGFEFELILSSANKDTLRQAIASVWCLIFLGGIGTRSRRGGGNLIVKEIRPSSFVEEIGLSFYPTNNTSTEIGEWIRENFLKVENIINKPKVFVADYSNLSFSRFLIAKEPKTSWQEALNEIGEIYQSFRKNKFLLDRAVFGLPLKYIKAFYKNEKIQRRNSPLIFKVIKIQNDFYWLILRFSGEFLPEGGRIVYQKKSKSPKYGIIDNFWKKLEPQTEEFFLTIPEYLKNILEKIKKQLRPKKIILFGSKARGDFHQRSDIDIAVEIDMPIANLELYGAVDIVDLKRVDKDFKEKIQREGIVVYAKGQ